MRPCLKLALLCFTVRLYVYVLASCMRDIANIAKFRQLKMAAIYSFCCFKQVVVVGVCLNYLIFKVKQEFTSPDKIQIRMILQGNLLACKELLVSGCA